MDVCTNHINYICNNWSKLKYEPILESDEIEKLTDNIIKIYLFCYYGYIDQLCKYDLLDLKLQLNIHNDNLYLLASFGGHIEAIEYLENKGFDITIKNNDGDNAYLLASVGGHIKVMEYLENKGFDINIKNNNGSNAYLLASCNGDIKVMEYLENKGFDINIKNNHGNNAYLLASRNGHIKVMEYLEMKGFDVTIKNNNGSNVYDLASLCGQIEVIQYLKNMKSKKYITECQSKSCESNCSICHLTFCMNNLQICS